MLQVLDGGNKEPFGFKDGISQPIMRGSKHWSEPRFAMHVVEPGELVLGYRDNLGYVSPSPCDHGRDIGRNGTFLVVRQLEQHVAEFDRYLAQEADRLRADCEHQAMPVPTSSTGLQPGWWAAGATAAHSCVIRIRRRRPRARTRLPRLPRRRPTSVARSIGCPTTSSVSAREDPVGLRCPLGAHIRRANPRDSFPARVGSPARDHLNRHRILRVGRVYQPQPSGKSGLLFMCINADIERQFEFLQQTWLLGPNFHGLDDEIDPVVGYRDAADSMTVPTPRGPVRMGGLSKFVSVLGGAYFFVPGRTAIRMLSAP